SAMAEKIVKANKKTIAVVDFTDLQGNVTELGRFLAEEFSVAMAGAGEGFEVVDRTHLKSLLQEHKLAMTGLIDPSTARKLGEIAGVQALITGTITPFGDSVRLSVKVLDTGTAKVIVGTAGEIPKTKAIEELLARGIETGQAAGPQAPTVGEAPPSRIMPSAPSPNSKKVEDILIAVKRIIVSREQVSVMLDFFNQSEKKFVIARSAEQNPDLIDEKGNVFDYDRGLMDHRHTSLEGGEYPILNPKSNTDVLLHFRPKDRSINIKELGPSFTFSLKYVLYDPKAKTLSTYNVVFPDIKAQLPK
ncbi:MAG: FlgO family outer membrane protein, partial [bacterium]